MNLQWYPGHMTKAKRMMQDSLKVVDMIIELVDARLPLSSRNPEIDKLSANKSRVILLNKADLADDYQTRKWKEYFERQGILAAPINSKDRAGINNVMNVIKKAGEAKRERDRKKGIISRPIRAMVVGIPNVGKSTFINSIAKKASAKTGNKPGVTKGKQWIRINKEIEFLDTPGILWPKFEDVEIGVKLAFIGSIKDELLNHTELSLKMIEFLKEHYKGALNFRYDVDESNDTVPILEEIAKNRHCLLKGNILDIDKAASILLDEFRSGKLGKVTLDIYTEVNNNE